MAAVQHEQGVATMNALAAIPPFPPIATKLLRLVSDEDVRLHRIVDLIRADPGFSSEVLQIANSSLHSLLRQVDSLREALVVIGLDRLKRLVVTVASRAYAKNFLEKPELHRCWRHMLACALLSEELARACSLDPDQAYTAGLMHDTGRLGLLVAFPDEYAELLRDVDREGAGEDTTFLLDRERETFGIDHCDAGHELAEKWGLPETFALIAGRHHDRHYGAEFSLLDVVALGCRLADGLGFDVVRTKNPWNLEQARQQLPEKVRPRFWANQAELRSLILERLENLDPGHGHLDRPGESNPLPPERGAAAYGAGPRSMQAAPIGNPLPAGEAQASPPDATSDAPALVSEAPGALPEALPLHDSLQEATMRGAAEINWPPLVLAITAILGLLVLLWWDPLGAG